MPPKSSRKETQIKLSEPFKTKPALDLTRTLMGEAFVNKSSSWDIIPTLHAEIRKRGILLPYDEYDEIAEDVWIHVSAYLSPSAKIQSPAIIGGGARLCHGSIVSGSVIGAFSTVGELSIVKDSVTFDRSRLCGQNCLMSSIIGYESVIGNGSTVVDSRLDGLNVTFDMPEGIYVTGRGHLGAVICDGVRIGSLCVINPGSVIDAGSTVYPMTSVSGYVSPYSSVK